MLGNEVTTNQFVWYAIMLCTCLMLLVFSVPELRLILGLTIVPYKAWLASILAAFTPLFLVQLYKIIFQQRAKRKR